MRAPFLTGLAALSLLACVQASADDAAQWIAKARSYLGSESALNAVQSLHFEGYFPGTELVPDPADPKKAIEQPVKVGIDIIFQQPMQQRQVLRSDKVERTTALDGYDGWERVAELGGKKGTRLMLMDAAGVKRLRATTVENLSFYSTQGANARRVQFVGEETVDGIVCVQLTFAHSDNVVFRRFFEKATGRLVKTVVEGGGEIREEGEMVVNGVRFPKRVVNKAGNGRSTTITFERITVNEKFPPATFAVPALQAK